MTYEGRTELVLGAVLRSSEKNIKTGSTGEDNDITYLDKKILAIDEVENMFYISLLVKDQTNVLSGVAKAFGDNDVSISSVVQNSSDKDEAELVIITHSAANVVLAPRWSGFRRKTMCSRSRR